MTFILGVYALMITAKILVTKFNKKSMWIACGVLLLGLISTAIWGKRAAFYNFVFLVSSATLILSMNQMWIIQIKRKFYSLPAIVFQIPLLLIPLYKTQMSPKLSFLVFGFSFIMGLLIDQFFSSPYPFSSYFEFNFYRSEKNKSKLPVAELQTYLKNNLANFVLGQIFIRNYNEASETDKRQYQKELLPSLLTYWVSKTSFTSMHPMAKAFNQLDMADIKESFTYYDLNNMDLPWIHDVFRCGCWKVGIYLLDQYLLTNKQSKMYTSSLLWSDRILNDLKRVSFDDESIENWLMDYRDRFKGTPLSTKIQLVYHNKDDWFEKSYRFAAL
ncbi:MAG: hypothetical protein JNM24_10030 [Bdellovibrionaceae bacterium]|nr:hypothetical protein [Pseudobdellovibrionaceae bacterium]